MIDSLYARYSRLKEKPLDPDYIPTKAIKNRLDIGESGADKVAVIFPGWHTHKFPVLNLAKRLAKRGWSVVVYDFHDQILLPDDEVVVESFRYVRDKITGDLNELVKHSKPKIHLIGISLGNVPLSLVADRFPHFQEATIVVGGDDLAVDMWYGLRTSHYQRDFHKLHIGIRKLDNEWHDLAPANHVRHFAGKPVLFYMSLRDKFIRTKYQRKLADKIAGVGADITIKKSRLGHTASIVRYCLFGSLPK